MRESDPSACTTTMAPPVYAARPPVICCSDVLIDMNAPRSAGAGTAEMSAPTATMRDAFAANMHALVATTISNEVGPDSCDHTAMTHAARTVPNAKMTYLPTVSASLPAAGPTKGV